MSRLERNTSNPEVCHGQPTVRGLRYTVESILEPDGNRMTDGAIAELADRDGRIVVTKDRDFRDGQLLGGTPRRLLVVATGNITNTALLALFDAHIAAVVAAFDEVDFVQLRPTALILHGGSDPS